MEKGSAHRSVTLRPRCKIFFAPVHLMPANTIGGMCWFSAKLAFTCVLFVAWLGFAESNGPLTPSQFVNKLQSTLQSGQNGSVENVIPFLINELGDGRTFAYASKGVQGAHRALLFGKDAGDILGIGETGQTLEVISDRGSAGLEAIHLNATSGKSSLPNSQVCQTCHGKDPVYIWREYRDVMAEDAWPGFLGQYDDRVEAGADERYPPGSMPDKVIMFDRIKKIKRFAPLFEPPASRQMNENYPHGIGKEAYPYWQMLRRKFFPS